MANVPPKLSVHEWKLNFLQYFPDLAFGHDDVINLAIDEVYDMFSGVSTIWSVFDMDTYNRKTKRCYSLLTAWHIAYVTPEWYPSGGGTTVGGFPISKKKIGKVMVELNTSGATSVDGDSLNILDVNVFGRMAKAMIKNSAKTAAFFGGLR